MSSTVSLIMKSLMTKSLRMKYTAQKKQADKLVFRVTELSNVVIG